MDKQTFINQVKGGAEAANNLFGIKRWGYPDFVEMPTTEYRSGQPVEEEVEFRKYPSWDYSIADHTDFLLKNDRYKNLIGIKDYKEACTLIQQDGYATDPNYSNLLIQIIEQNELQKYVCKYTGII